MRMRANDLVYVPGRALERAAAGSAVGQALSASHEVAHLKYASYPVSPLSPPIPSRSRSPLKYISDSASEQIPTQDLSAIIAYFVARGNQFLIIISYRVNPACWFAA